MPTVKRRINVSLPQDVERALSKVARRDRVPEATKAARLIELALEIEEDRVWDIIASNRDRAGAKFLSHRKAWA